jgi:hypothetical protein
MVIIMLAGVMFPLWPVKLRIGVWYLSILALGLLGALIVLAIVRLIFWCITVVVCKKAIWMFPNLFEDVGFVSISSHSFIHSQPLNPTTRLRGRRRRSTFSLTFPSYHLEHIHPALKVRIVRATLIPVRFLCPSMGIRRTKTEEEKSQELQQEIKVREISTRRRKSESREE